MTHTSTEKPEALRIADLLEQCSLNSLLSPFMEVADELRRQHARIEELESQLSAIGAGGVEPLRKQAVPQWDGKINPADFNVETFRRSGNSWLVKTDNCMRITHVPTGLFEEGVSERSIHTNKAEAWERLSARLEALAAAPQPTEAAPAQPVAEPAKADSVLEDALSDAVRVPLDSLHADAAYLIGRLREGSMPYARVIEIIRERIDAAKAAIRARASHGQAPATQQGAADGFFLLLPQRPKPEAPAGTAGLDWDAYSGAQMLAFGRDCSDAAIAALRTQQPAPAAVTGPVAVLKFERGTPGRQNEMPRVVSCNRMPDGEYEVYLAAAHPAEGVPNERAAFEAWLRVKPCGAAHDFAWEAWRARAALAATQPAAQGVEQDAARYRWLRNESWACYNIAKKKPEVALVAVVRDGACNVKMVLAEDAMDTAVDAALAAQAKQGGAA